MSSTLDADPLQSIAILGDAGRVTGVWKAGAPVKKPAQ
jgi:hypothetical protein